MERLRLFILILLAVAGFICGVPRADAADDGFGYGPKQEGQYVIVLCAEGVDGSRLARQLGVTPSDMVLSGGYIRPREAGETGLVEMLDALFTRVSDILDMRLYDLKPVIKIGATYADLDTIYGRLFGRSLGGRRSFYVYDLNTIYVSAEDFRQGIVGHEMAHAIISRFFPVPAPVKVQEVLAMYVEYNLQNPK